MNWYLKVVGWCMKHIWYLLALSGLLYFIPIYTLAAMGAILVLYVITWIERKGMEILDNVAQAERKAQVCPHGHEGWDDCPDCCH